MEMKKEEIEELCQKIMVSILVVIPLIGTAAAMVLLWNRYVFPSDIILLVAFYGLTVIGITVGYHRMLTHHGFESHPLVRAVLLILGAMSFEGPPDRWAATHIKHHAHSDQEEDPHTPIGGFWHAHMGWLFSNRNFVEAKEYAPHLLKDPVVMFVSRWVPLWSALSLILPFLLGGWTGLLWGGAVRIFLVNHVTWSVNSVCHVFGKHPFLTADASRNHWIVGLLAFGEGWHNNHHAFPPNAFHGLHWWQFDLAGLIIRGMERLGLMWNVRRVSKESVRKTLSKADQVRQTLMELRDEVLLNIQEARQTLAELITDAKGRIPPGFQKGGLAMFGAVQKDAMESLEKIQRRLIRLHHIKQQQILDYQIEIQDLIQSARDRIQAGLRRNSTDIFPSSPF